MANNWQCHQQILHLVDEAAEEVDDDDQQWPVVDDEVDADEDKEEEPPGVLLSKGERRLANLPSIKRGPRCFLPHRSQRLKQIHWSGCNLRVFHLWTLQWFTSD